MTTLGMKPMMLTKLPSLRFGNTPQVPFRIENTTLGALQEEDFILKATGGIYGEGGMSAELLKVVRKEQRPSGRVLVRLRAVCNSRSQQLETWEKLESFKVPKVLF